MIQIRVRENNTSDVTLEFPFTCKVAAVMWFPSKLYITAPSRLSKDFVASLLNFVFVHKEQLFRQQILGFYRLLIFVNIL
jgi:hypothetical protein